MEQFPYDNFAQSLAKEAAATIANVTHSASAAERAKEVFHRQLAKAQEPAFWPQWEANAAPAFDGEADVKWDTATVQIGHKQALTEEQHNQLVKHLDLWRPWKKGPYSLFGVEIDSEWQSNLKWQRLKEGISPLKGRRVCDIGCHNGYFMFRMMAEAPELVVGIEPVIKHWLCFHYLNSYAKQNRISYLPLGVEHLDLMQNAYDTIFCLGILYHHTDPVGLLRKMRQALRPKGEIIIDCQGIPGTEPHCLVPSGRYAGARGVWFVPTQTALTNWIKRAGYTDVRPLYAGELSTDEQRRTSWANVDSLEDFLDPADSGKTREGYPRPWRFYMVASR